MRFKKFDLNRAPFRGIISEIATEQGSSPSAVWRGVHTFRNPRLLIILEQKINDRNNIIKRIKKEVGVCNN